MHAHGRAGSIADVSAQWPSLEELWRTLTLQAGFNAAVVVAGTALLGVAAGIIGAFALLRKRALMGDAISHATLPGIALGFIIAVLAGAAGKNIIVLLAGAAATGVLAVITIQLIIRHTRLTEDAAIGAVLSVFFGVGVVLLGVIQNMATGGQAGLGTFIYGQTAAMSRGEAVLMGGAALMALAAALLLLKEFALVCFDQDFAGAQGWRVSLIDLLMMSLVVVVTVIGLQAVGLLLVVAMLIIPSAAARFWTERLWVMISLAGLFGGMSGYAGASASALLPRMPAGAVIVLTAGCIFTASLLFAPARGVIANALRAARMRIKIAGDHFLREMHELLTETHGEPLTGVRTPLLDVASRRGWSLLTARLIAANLARSRLIRRHENGVSLTDEGVAAAQRVTRTRRLWEQYLISYADIAPSHVDWSADVVEHVLSPELVRELERALERRLNGEAPA